MRQACQDIMKGADNHEFWLVFGKNDVKSKYRRSVLGHWWTTLTVYLFIIVVGTLYKDILSVEMENYFAYFAVGYILWTFISDNLTSGCKVLINSKTFILQKEWAVSTFVFRSIYKEIILSLHNIFLLPVIFIWIGLIPSASDILLSIVSYIVCVFTVFWVVLFLSILSLRFRDIVPLIQSMMRLAFFITPVVWVNRDLDGVPYWINLINPFQYYIEIVRNPLLSQPIQISTWLTVACISLSTIVISLYTLAITKKSIPIWL